ncbi:type 4 pilus major pilin [Desulfovibrio falkowii]|uniref:Type 4 secretion system PilS N-terminal domain-containing protein n=1 Tax=Desulfovibrio falkowii TaxID=3136602 RepID=A0ABQ0E5N3_9BACT
MNMMEVLGALLIALVVIAGSAVYLNTGFSRSKVVSLEQDLVSMRMQIQQFFSGSSDYSGLDSETAIKAGIVPKSLIKGSSLKTPWGGEIALSTNSSNGSFTIELSGIPQEECTQLAKFQSDAWLSVEVNGNALSADNNVSDIVNNCTSVNTIAYEVR